MSASAIWHTRPTVEQLNAFGSSRDAAMRLGMVYEEVGDDFLSARLPVDERTRQPFGLLHGGVSCVVSESLGSVGSSFCVDPQAYYCVGIEINANHLRSARQGSVLGVARPLKTGRRIQVWETRLFDEQERLVCISRLTTAVLARAE